MTAITSSVSKLRDLIVEYFNGSEFQVLCVDLNIGYEELSGDTLKLKAQELVSYCYRHNRTDELIAICKQARPHASWSRLGENDDDLYLPDNQPLVQTPKLGKIPIKLEKKEIEEFLSQNTEWRLIEIKEPSVPRGIRQELYRVYEFPTYLLAFSFMQEVSSRAIEKYNHHPRWQNTFNRLEVWLTTFNLGYKPSNKDLRLARIFEKVWQEFNAELF